MTRFFHLSRGPVPLPPGFTFDASIDPLPPGFCPPELHLVARDLFPGGMTNHGWHFLTRMRTDLHVAKELAFEYVRRAEFPGRPSRFTSIFGAADIEAAQSFRMRNPYADALPGGTIYEVEADESFRANLVLLDPPSTGLELVKAARSYWSGEQGLAPVLWEALLVPPVRVIAAVA